LPSALRAIYNDDRVVEESEGWDCPRGCCRFCRRDSSIHYTAGSYDVVMVVEGSDEAVTSALLRLGSLGNIRTQTLRGISVEELKAIIGKTP